METFYNIGQLPEFYFKPKVVIVIYRSPLHFICTRNDS